ncbi:hypothetical protein JTB14_032114 [Gonioctena quinquepunctata]|nr:hypothetical protein JTB14_032114 [Gonioctena quinquepunctata]
MLPIQIATNPTVICVTDDNNDSFLNDKDMADYCNRYFINVGQTMASKIDAPPPDYKLYEPTLENSMFLKPVDDNELVMHITSLKNNSASGLDGVSSKLIKSCHIYILQPLKHIINRIFSNGKVPIQFKTSSVTPIYKSGRDYTIF